MPMGIGGVVILFILSLIFGKDFFSLVGVTPTESTQPAGPGTVTGTPQEERMVDFMSFVLNDAQDAWRKQFAATGKNYQDARLVLFRDAVRSGCGVAQSATGPFYCPTDQKVYLDLSFFEELHRRFGAPGDFAQAYVVAHEIGHHVQHQLGIEQQVRRGMRGDPRNANALSVRLELQADCMAGVWGHSTARRDILEQGDVEEGLRAAAAIGDDRMQGAARGGQVNPESFTHGTSQQRVSWFRRGLESGQLSACDTFNSGG